MCRASCLLRFDDTHKTWFPWQLQEEACFVPDKARDVCYLWVFSYLTHQEDKTVASNLKLCSGALPGYEMPGAWYPTHLHALGKSQVRGTSQQHHFQLYKLRKKTLVRKACWPTTAAASECFCKGEAHLLHHERCCKRAAATLAP
mmetsp:Transcript_8443/g.31146  ORF Transcript_8443/g.31146 Transcript_8443/m.31146 type:complete len:145 (+) Transcript_8443:1583-2017(+)